jgi:hypothetical protein
MIGLPLVRPASTGRLFPRVFSLPPAIAEIAFQNIEISESTRNSLSTKPHDQPQGRQIC